MCVCVCVCVCVSGVCVCVYVKEGGREGKREQVLSILAVYVHDHFYFRRLLFLSIGDILGDEAVVSGDPLPHSYVLNFLFSRAPSEMRSPHQVDIVITANSMLTRHVITCTIHIFLVYMCAIK